RFRVAMRDVSNDFPRNTRFALRVFQSVGLDRAAVLEKSGSGIVDEFPVLETGCEDLTADRIGQNDVRADVETGPYIGPLDGTGAPRINPEEARTMTHPL